MDKLITAVALSATVLFSTTVFANPDDSCDGEKLIFSGYTTKGSKYVGVCWVYGNIRYVYGKDGKKPDIVLNVPEEKVQAEVSAHGDATIVIPNGKYAYEIVEPAKYDYELNILKNGDRISSIQLNQDSVESEVGGYVSRRKFGN